MRDMKTTIGNYEMELSGSLITIRKNGETTKVIETNPWEAVHQYNELVGKLQKMNV
jgi:hypothetical protein